MKTQVEWRAEAKALADGGTLFFPWWPLDRLLCDRGVIVGQEVDQLTRAILEKLGLKLSGISAPSWSCAWTSKSLIDKACFELGHWSLGSCQVGVFREKGGWQGGFDIVFLIPDMPSHEWNAHRRNKRPFTEGEDFIDLLALHHFALHVFDTMGGSDQIPTPGHISPTSSNNKKGADR